MSSLPESSPLMLTDFPMLASPPGAVLIRCLPAGQIKTDCKPSPLRNAASGTETWVRTLDWSGPWIGQPIPRKRSCVQQVFCIIPLKVRSCWCKENMAIRPQFAGVSCALTMVVLASSLCAAANRANENLSPIELVRQAVNNEVASNRESGRHFMFKDVKETAHLSQVKLMVETTEATAGLLIARDGHPLSPEERKQEEARLQNYVRNPQELSKKRKQEKEDADHTMRILKALPDAFLYETDTTEAGTESIGRPGHELVRLKFRPNP